jgi:hypothetical protein
LKRRLPPSNLENIIFKNIHLFTSLSISITIMSKRTRFVQETIIGLGFLNGLWLRFGVNPQDELFRAFVNFIGMFSSNYAIWISGILALLSFTLLAISIMSAFWRGGRSGIVAVLMAMAGGFLLGQIGAGLLVFAMLLGFVSCRK